MHHRSDWPEVGLSAALGDGELSPFQSTSGDTSPWVHETGFAGIPVRWLCSQNAFESQLDGFPIWKFHVEAGCGDFASSGREFLQLLHGHLSAEIARLPKAVPLHPGYVCSKVVAGEPLHGALARWGFEEIEKRRLYRTPVQRMLDRRGAAGDASLRFTTLETLPEGDRSLHHAQLLDICREAFGQQGFSRHFTDPFLLERRSGLDYILAVMQLNFERLRPVDFVVAIDDAVGRIVGFSVVGQKPGLTGASHTQLLSAVADEYRGREVYRSLTCVLTLLLPRDATLLNVTQVGNGPMQRAYHLSGRVHVADTVLMRRVFR